MTTRKKRRLSLHLLCRVIQTHKQCQEEEEEGIVVIINNPAGTVFPQREHDITTIKNIPSTNVHALVHCKKVIY